MEIIPNLGGFNHWKNSCFSIMGNVEERGNSKQMFIQMLGCKRWMNMLK